VGVAGAANSGAVVVVVAIAILAVSIFFLSLLLLFFFFRKLVWGGGLFWAGRSEARGRAGKKQEQAGSGWCGGAYSILP